MKKSIPAILATLLVTQHINAVEINENFSATIGIQALSEYRRSGLDLSNGDPVVQTSASINHKKSGLSLELFASNYDVSTETQAELSYGLGYFHAFSDKNYLYSALSRIHYPKQSEWNQSEIYLHYFLHGLTVDFYQDFYDEKGGPKPQYRYLGYKHYLPYDMSVWAKVGYNDIDSKLYDADGSTRSTYIARSVKVTKMWKEPGLEFSLTYSDTDMSKHECLYYMGYENKCDSAVVFGVKKEF
ncbi:hypothetical protein QDR63_18720 [Acinetobacter baumannii]|uniref:TorF family putative porin n=1 Tax=Acinetobacter baumannii TaxID=470 RepID=UPI00244993AE|nr:TorF family putative porin [Acinetobacter baumannii]MDH2528293.1 hypothetical protein [Acinetobacter baumannii]